MKQKADKKAQVEHSKISLAIFEYITTQLNHCIEDDVFEAGSIKELGYVYYKKILTANVSFSEEHVRAFIRRFARDDSHIEHDSDYFEELCAYIGIKELPKAVRQEVFRKYNEVFVQMYASVLSKHNAAIKQVEREEAQAEKDINAILSGRSSIPISHDITAAEEELIAIYRKQDELRSRKDALEFAKDMVDSFLLRFSRSIPQKDSDRIDSRRLKQKVEKAKNMIRNCRVHLFDRWYHQLSIHESEHDLSPVERAIRKNSLDICKGFSTAEKVVLPYKGYLDLWKDDIERPYALSFKIKCYSIREVGKKRYFHQCSLLGEEKAYNLYIEQLNKLPPIEELYNAKNHNPSYYLDLLRKLVRDFNIFSEMKSTLSETVCLRYRKEFLLKAITLFETGEYSIVNCIIPLQIEGIFFDFLIDQTTFSRFKDLDLFPQEVLKDKIKILLEMKEGIYPEAAEYFQNYYNNGSIIFLV